MTPERIKELEEDDVSSLTIEECLAGWHFCYEWDGLLVGPGMPELEFCQCFAPELKEELLKTIEPLPELDPGDLDSVFGTEEKNMNEETAENKFMPFAWYNQDGKLIEFIGLPDPFFARIITEKLDVHVSQNDEKTITGCTIWSTEAFPAIIDLEVIIQTCIGPVFPAGKEELLIGLLRLATGHKVLTEKELMS